MDETWIQLGNRQFPLDYILSKIEGAIPVKVSGPVDGRGKRYIVEIETDAERDSIVGDHYLVKRNPND